MNDYVTLAEQYAYQKWLALKKVGITRELGTTMEKAKQLYAKHTKPMADMLNAKGISIDPGVVMEAVFAKARSQKHFDGPFPNSLQSWKYVKEALAAHLELPSSAAEELLSVGSMLKRMDDLYENCLPRMQEASSVAYLSSIPIEFKIHFLRESGHPKWMNLVPELLEQMENHQIIRRWVTERIMSYEELAKAFNTR